MAVPFLTSITLNKNEVQNFKVFNLGTDPGDLTADDKGYFWLNTDVLKLRYWSGTAVRDILDTSSSISGGQISGNISGNAANVTGTVAVANGGTGTATGSITGTGALTFTSGGANNNLVLVPKGTGTVVIGDGTGYITGNITGEAGTALKLSASKTLWGQSFDGSANVTGNLTSVGDITGTGAITVTAGGTDTSITLAPNGSGTVNLSGKRLSNLASPADGLDAVNRNYVDSVVQGLDAKSSCYVATATGGDIILSNPGTISIDGVSYTNFTVDETRILVKDQSDPKENGIYIWHGTASAMTRSPDANTWAELVGAYVFIEKGGATGTTGNAYSGWICSIPPTGTLGTDNVTFVKFSQAGSYTPGRGITQSGTAFNFAQDAAYTADTIPYASGPSAIGFKSVTGTGDVVLAAAPTLTGLTTAASINVGSNTLVANLASYTGKVGIGTATPATTLHVFGTGAKIRVATNATDSGTIDLSATSTSAIINAKTYATAVPLKFQIDDSDKLTIATTGVGTATASWSFEGVKVGMGGGTLDTNTAVGKSALSANSAGVGITVIGQDALSLNTTGNYNTAVGFESLNRNTTGAYNTSIGRASLYNNKLGVNSTSIGYQSLYYATTQVATVTISNGGSGYGNGSYTNVQLVYVSGSTALSYPTANITVSGGAVTLISIVNGGSGFKDTTTVLTALAAALGGSGSGLSLAVATLASGENNTAVGYAAGFSVTKGSENTLLGNASGFQVTTSSGNTYVGYACGYLSNGGSNAAFGHSAFSNASNTANYVTAIGRESLYNCTGSYNTALGHQSGSAITSGTKNTIIGRYSGNQGGLDIRTSSNYIVLSDGDGNPRQVIDNNGNLGLGTASPNSYGTAFRVLQASATDSGIIQATGTTNSVTNEISTTGTIGQVGTRTNHTLTLKTNDTNRVWIDTAGNLGLGVTPASWAGGKAFEFGTGTANGSICGLGDDTNIATNAYYNSGWKYIGATYISARYRQNNGIHSWFSSTTNGGAGAAIGYTQTMTLDASGRLLLGTTSGVGTDFVSIKWNSSTAYSQAINIVDSYASANSTAYLVFRKSDDTYLGNIRRDGTNTALYVGGNSYLALGTGDTTRLTISSTGAATFTGTVTASSSGTGTGQVGVKYTSVLAASGTATTQTLTHSLGTKNLVATLRQISTDKVVYADITFATVDTVKIDFASTQTLSDFQITLIG